MRDEEGLLKRAEEALAGCYAPYSGIRVTAVLEASDGSIYTGVNVENASYGLTICAERSALSAAAAAGKRKFRRIVIYSPDCLPLPCGACRQVLKEFCNGEM
ncbi:MAG: cytidine deaminase, partial [Candidatus Aegiribacteria sp.]|nr:cytidine deaminase [Candidatus Aegiribacteria sp.]